MTDRQQGATRREDAERQEVERIMRAGEALGHDPGRIARALGHVPLEDAPTQRTMEVKRRPTLPRFLARGLARRS
jgi:hypothetical protein